MIEVLSLVNFNNARRVAFLQRGWGSFYRYFPKVRHIVLDSSKQMGSQREWYAKYKVELYHVPDMPYGARLKLGAEELREDYFVFLPDDFEWIFAYELENALAQARKHNIDALKFVCRGMTWFAQKNPQPIDWYTDARLCSGEVLQRLDDLYVSKRQWRRNFHEQFSLSCNAMKSEFARATFARIPEYAVAPGNAEKWAYLKLIFTRYLTAYYKMQTPAFHFADLAIEGDNEKNRERAGTNLLPENIALFNQRYNRI